MTTVKMKGTPRFPKRTPPNNFTGAILDEVAKERWRQLQLWGEQFHEPDRWLAILMEEVGETAQAQNEQKRAEYRKEMIQVAAVAVAAIEALDKQND